VRRSSRTRVCVDGGKIDTRAIFSGWKLSVLNQIKIKNRYAKRFLAKGEFQFRA
jgi:hypothetical protein